MIPLFIYASLTRRRSGWGCTVNLKFFAQGDAIIDGSPERVVEPIDFDASLGAIFEFAGFTRTVRGNSGDDDETFVGRLRHGLDLSYLQNTLLDLIS